MWIRSCCLNPFRGLPALRLFSLAFKVLHDLTPAHLSSPISWYPSPSLVPVVFSNWPSLFKRHSLTMGCSLCLELFSSSLHCWELTVLQMLDEMSPPQRWFSKPHPKVATLSVTFHPLPCWLCLGTYYTLKSSFLLMCLFVYGLSLPLRCKLMKTGSLSSLFTTRSGSNT